MPEIIPKIKTAIILLIMGLLFASLVTVLVVGISYSGDTEVTISQFALLVGEIFLPVPVIFWAKRMKSSYKKFFRLKPVSQASLLSAIPLGIGLTIITDELDRIAQMIHPVPESFSQINEIMIIKGPTSALFIIGVVIILAPFVEEIIFRGFFQRVLEYRLKDVTKAVLFSALTFAIVHFNPWWVIQIYLIGLFLGYVAWRTNSIWISFFLHALNNGVAVWFAHQTPESISWYEWRGHTSPFILIIGVVLFYVGIRLFISVTPISQRTEEVVNIEDIYGSSSKLKL